MGRKYTTGLQKRNGIWYIDKQISRRRICESCGTSDLKEAERYLAKRLEEIRQASIYGVRPERLFKEAAIKFLEENEHLASLDRYARALRMIDPFIGNLPLNAIHMGSVQDFIQRERRRNITSRTINYSLQAVRRIVNLAAKEWLDEHNLTWLANAPKIKLLPEHDKRPPYPLSWEEQNRLFKELPDHLEKMALFAVNTGCRETEICSLQWDWEVKVPELPSGLVFIIPKGIVKNREERVVVINETAREVIEACRHQNATHVFTYKDKPLKTMLNDGWIDARKRADLSHVRVHDLKHTFGRRLRAAGVSFEDRQDLLGHRSGRITTHYSAAELNNLYEAANRVCKQNGSYPTLTLLRRLSDYSHDRKNVVDLQTYAHKREPLRTESRKSHAEALGN